MRKIEKCHECKREIRYNKKNFLLYKKNLWHLDCFKKHNDELKRGKLTQEEIDLIYNETIESSWFKEQMDRNEVYKFIQKQYDVVILTNSFIGKLEEIFEGTYKGISEAIRPEDLLEIWKLQMNNLNKQYAYNTNKGKFMDCGMRLMYDLAIIVSKFKSYKDWQERVKRDKKEIDERISKPKIDYSKLAPKNQDDETNTKENGDLDWLVDY